MTNKSMRNMDQNEFQSKENSQFSQYGVPARFNVLQGSTRKVEVLHGFYKIWQIASLRKHGQFDSHCLILEVNSIFGDSLKNITISLLVKDSRRMSMNTLTTLVCSSN